MAEPAVNAINSLPRFVCRQGMLKRMAKSSKKPSLANNFFTPTPRHEDGTLKAVESPPLKNVLHCQDWAYPSSKEALWCSDSLMRNVLMSELSEHGSSQQVRRTSNRSRQKTFRTYSSATATTEGVFVQQMSFSTNSSPISTTAEPRVQYTPFEPRNATSADKSPMLIEPIQSLTKNLKYQVKSARNLDELARSFGVVDNEGILTSMSTHELFKLAEDLAKQIDGLCVDLVRYKHIHSWGQKLFKVTEHIPLDLNVEDQHRRTSLIFRSAAFQHNFQEVEPYFEKMPRQSQREHNRVLDPFQSVFMSYILSLANKEGLGRCMEYLYAEGNSKYYKYFGDYFLFRRLVVNARDLENVISLESLTKPRILAPMIDTLVRICCKEKDYKKALSVLDAAADNGVDASPKNVLHTCLGLATTSNAHISAAQRLFETVPETNLDLYWKVKLYLAGRSGETDVTRSILDELQSKGNLTDNDITLALHSMVKENNLNDFDKLFDTFFPVGEDGVRTRKPNIYHYTIAAQADAQRADPRGVSLLLEDMKKSKVTPTTIFCTSLMHSFAQKGDIPNVLSTYEYMKEARLPMDAAAYTVVISVVARRQDCEAASKIFIEAIKDGIVPDQIMTNSLMNAYVEAGSWQDAIEVFHHLTTLPTDLQPPIDTYNIILKAYVLAGAPFRLISKLFRRLEEIGGVPDNYTFATLIQSAADVEDLNLVKRLYRDVRARQERQGYKNVITRHILTLIMNAFLRRYKNIMAKRTFNEMIELGIKPSSITFGQIVRSYGHDGDAEKMQQAEEFVKKLIEERDWEKHPTKENSLSHLYFPLIKRESKAGNVEEVERLYSEYLDAGGQPTQGILQQILWVYCSVGDTVKAREVFDIIFDMAKSKPIGDSIHTSMANIRWQASMYIRLLSESGLHSTVLETWSELQAAGYKFDSHNWNHLAAALVRGGHVEQAFDIMENVILPAERQVQTAYAQVEFEEGATLEMKLSLLDNIEKPPLEPPLRSGRDRKQAAMSGALDEKSDLLTDEEVIEADFTQPLKTFEYLAAQEGLWKPHTGVLRTFLIALLKLQRGYPITPVPVGALVKDNIAPSEANEKDISITQPILERLYATRPQTIERLRAFEEYEKHHHGPITFESIYIRR